MKKNIFLEKFREKTERELIEILEKSEEYTPEAIEATKIILIEKNSKHTNFKHSETKGQPSEKYPKNKNETKGLKFYSQKSIGFATFLGGPLAAGYLIRENYLSLNKPEQGKNSLIIGIIASILLFVLIFTVPEEVMDKIPNQLLPLIYTGITLYIVAKIHGTILFKHKENGNEFYSGWKAVGISLISAVILIIGVFGYVYFSPSGEEFELYDSEIARFSKNENEALTFYDFVNSETNDFLLQELENNSIPKLRENIEIIKKLSKVENLPLELLQQNEILLKYSELRLKAFILMEKAINEDTEKYSQELRQMNFEINKLLDKLN